MTKIRNAQISDSRGRTADTGTEPLCHTAEVVTVAGIGEKVLTPDIWSPTIGEWHVIHTKPRQEKALAEALQQKSIRYFLPLIQQTRIYGHRRRNVEIPLFAGYLFLRGSKEATYSVFETRRVVQILPVFDQAVVNQELKQIELALRGQGVLDPYPFIVEGKRVRVKAGPFRGLEGIVDARKRKDRIILLVETIGQATSLEIDASLLEALE